MPKFNQLGTCLLLLVISASANSQAQKLEATQVAELGGIFMMTRSLQQMRDTCSELYPSQKDVFHGLYKASAIPRYTGLFKADVRQPKTASSREAQLQSLGMSEAEANNWCSSDFPKMLDLFDKQYAHRFEQMERAFSAVERAAAKRKVPEPPSPPPLDPMFGEIFNKIVEASSLSFNSGNWTLLADIYEPGTFDCWQAIPGAGDYGFLALVPIPKEANVKVKKFERYLTGNGDFPSDRMPTHLMEASYEFSRDGRRCGKEKRKRWPKQHFFLIQKEDSFVLTHYCPSGQAVESGKVFWDRPPTADQLKTNISLLNAEDWRKIPEGVQKDFHASEITTHLQQAYDFSYEEVNSVIDHVCDPTSTPPSE